MKQAPLPTRLRRARKLLLHWKRSCPRYAVRELNDFDSAIQAVNEAIKIASVPQLEKPSSHGGLTQCDMHEDESL